MKQNDSYQDFDKQVQQLLGQASEPVPEGAWEAIAARLAAGTAAADAAGASAGAGTAGAGASSAAAETGATRKAVILKWVRRTGIAVAAAAAVLLAVLLWNRPENTTDDNLAVVTAQEQDQPLAAIPQQSAVPSEQATVSDEQSTVAFEQNSVATKPIAAAPKQGSVVKQSIAIASRGAVLAQAETQPTEAQAESQQAETQTESETAETQIESQLAEPQVESRTADVQATEPQVEPLTAEAEVQPIDWEHLPDLEDEAQSRTHKKYQPNGFHLAAYTNALSNFTSKKSGQYTGYSGTSGGSIPDHSYFRDRDESKYSIPLTFGINFAYDILPKLSVGLGVNYTRLSRQFSGTYYQLQDNGTFTETDYDNIYNIQQFIGIPLSVYYHIVRTKHINFYVYANGTVEKCIGNAFTANNREVNYNEPVKGVQFNAGGGIGVDFMLAPLVSIYLDPNVKYYFGLNQPKSIRTKQPFMLGFEAGVRFHL